jgi:chemotaxis protein methyltransferase CheR
LRDRTAGLEQKFLLEQTKEASLHEFLEHSSFQKIKRLIHESAGLSCAGYRDEYLKRRFEIRLRATGANTYSKYVTYLRKNPGEISNLLNDLTVNYTNFFRDTEVYVYLEKVLLPKLFHSKDPVRIWSAGCASGEEPYSIAILIHKVLGRTISNHPVTIFASDIDKDSLSKAALGDYQHKQLGALDQPLIDQFFTKEANCYRVKDSVRQLIRFEQFDLMKPTLHQNLDLILCRNVMIYFSKEGQQQIHMGFYNALRDGGYFITGKSEILSGEPYERFVAVDTHSRVYQKPPKNLSAK